jgi:tight adherence protein C
VKPKEEEDISYLRRIFLKAGYRGGNTLIIFFGTKVFFAVWLPLLFSLTRLVIHMNIPSLTFLLISILLAMMGFYLPNLWIKMRISNRKEKMQQGLPDALDLMVVCVEAGTGLDAAINRVGEEMKLSNEVLSEEFRLMSMELRAGKQRRNALKNLALRTDLEDVSSLVTLLIQTEKFGTSLAQALRVHSDSMRTKRFQKAEEIAAKLPVKLMFPLVLFIFPSIFVVILGPAAIRIFRTLFPALAGG